MEQELGDIYNGSTKRHCSRQYKDYSEWMHTRNLESQKMYWESEYSEEIPVLSLPLDYTRPQEQSYEGNRVYVSISEDLKRSLRKLSQKTGTTEYMIYLSAAMILLGKYSYQEDIVVGSPISGRVHRDTEDMLGMFVNTLVIRGRPEKRKSYLEFLEEIKQTCLRAYENQEYPFEELIETIGANRDLSHNPMFDVMVVMQ